jgi:hypothetical protein
VGDAGFLRRQREIYMRKSLNCDERLITGALNGVSGGMEIKQIYLRLFLLLRVARSEDAMRCDWR